MMMLIKLTNLTTFIDLDVLIICFLYKRLEGVYVLRETRQYIIRRKSQNAKLEKDGITVLINVAVLLPGLTSGIEAP